MPYMYVQQKREQLNLDDDHLALAMFKGQCTDEVFKILEDSHIDGVLVPANCTDRLQPLDISVNHLISV